MSDYSFDPDDLSFLDDLADVDKFMDEQRYSCHGMVFNSGGDCYPVGLSSIHDVNTVIEFLVGDTKTCTQVIVPHGDLYYRFFLHGINPKGHINYHLQNFTTRVGLDLVPSRCLKAFCFVVKMPTLTTEVLVDIPEEFRVRASSRIEDTESYTMALRCAPCFTKKSKCDRNFPCGECREDQCQPRGDLIPAMAARTYSLWNIGKFSHSDILKYHIYRQSLEVESRAVVKNVDVKHLVSRIEATHPKSCDSPPRQEIVDLPVTLANIIKEVPIYKVEWLYADNYASTCSRGWERQLQSDVRTKEIARSHKVPFSMCDTIGMQDCEANIKMLIDSVDFPLVPAVYHGKIMWMGDGNRCITSTVTRTSIVISAYHIISVVTVKRGYVCDVKDISKMSQNR